MNASGSRALAEADRQLLAPLQPYQPLYTLLSLGVELALALALAGVASRLLGRLLRRYGAAPIRKLGTGSSELLLLLEFAGNAALRSRSRPHSRKGAASTCCGSRPV